VHNAPAGYWSIATGATAPSTSLCAFDGSFGAGLLEALCQVQVARNPVLLIAYDTGYPEPLHRVRPISDAFGIALLLSPERGERTLGRVDVELTADAADVMADPRLESLRSGYPTARGLPLLMALARGQAHRHVLDYLDDRRLAVTTTPC
jgi:Beta-ketoacyl synthase, N-terminal domain